LEVIADNRDKFEVVGIAAGGANPDLVVEQARTFNLSADRVAVANTQAAAKVADALGGAVVSSAAQLVREVEADTVLNALVGLMPITVFRCLSGRCGRRPGCRRLRRGRFWLWPIRSHWLQVVPASWTRSSRGN